VWRGGVRGQKLEAGIEGKGLIGSVHSHSGLWIFSNTFLEKVCFSLKADHFHPFKRNCRFCSVCGSRGWSGVGVHKELDVVAHLGRIHPDEFDEEGFHCKFYFNVACIADDVNDACFGETDDQFGVEGARKVAVEPFIATDESIAKTEAGYESALLEPKYDTERAQEDNAFNRGECNQSFSKLALVGLHHLRAQLAMGWTYGTVSIAWSRCSFSVRFLTYVSMRRE
jgi:hypothetical protein